MEHEALFDKIEAYLIGQMDEAEHADFERQIASDEDLAMEVELQKLEHDAMTLLNQKNLRLKMQEWEAEMPDDESDSVLPPLTVVAKDETKSSDIKVIPLSNYWMRFVAAASLILGVVLIGLWVNRGTKPEVVKVETPKTNDSIPSNPLNQTAKSEENITKSPTLPAEKPVNPQTTLPPQYNELLAYVEANLDDEIKNNNVSRSDNDGKQDNFKDISDTYKAKNYKRALELLQKKPNNSSNTLAHQEWLGLVNFKLKAYNKALSYFQSLINNQNAAFSKERTQWNIALCYAAQYPNKANELRNILNEIIAEKDNKYFDKATALKSKL